ncbi:hypothetical protein B0H10DRAFT_1799583, partial [Mycena sp. CBHHK59/15]
LSCSCAPNVSEQWDSASFMWTVLATRPIAKGEEITASYIPEELPYSARQEKLQFWGFTCACRVCSLPRAARARSDNNRLGVSSPEFEEIFDPEDERPLLEWVADRSLPDDHIKQCRIAWDVLEEEGVSVPVARAAIAQRMCKAHCALKDESGAREWATLAQQLAKALLFPPVLQAARWNQVIEHPQRTDWWGRRVRNGGPK